MLIERQDRIFKNMEESRQTQNHSVEFFKTDARDLIEKVNEVSAKIMDFEKNKRNNLIIFGIPDDPQESPSTLDGKIQEIFRNILLISRDIDFLKVSRLMIGPEVAGCRPVIMTFRLFRDRDEVFRKAGMLRGSGLHISEDVTRKARDSRTELRRFLREMKMKDPQAVCKLEYDRMVVNGRSYVWSEEIQAIVDTMDNTIVYDPRVRARDVSCSPTRQASRAPSRVGSRARSHSRNRVFSRSNSKVGSRSRDTSKPGSPTHSKHPLLQLGESFDEENGNEMLIGNKMHKIRDLEESVRCQEELMELLKEKLIEGPTNGEHHEQAC